MYTLMNALIVLVLSFFTQVISANHCCKNECFEFKDAKYTCSLTTNDLQILEAGFLNNATVRSKHIIGNEAVDGDVTVLGNAEFNNGVVVNGELIIDGVPFVPGITEFAYFAFQGEGVVIASQALVPFNIDVESTAGITLNPDGSFTLAEAGIYSINFSVSISDVDSAFCLSTVPTGVTTNIENTTFARGAEAAQNVGFTIIQTTEANTTIGVRSALSTTTQTTITPIVAGSTIAAVQIIKIG